MVSVRICGNKGELGNFIFKLKKRFKGLWKPVGKSSVEEVEYVLRKPY